MDFTFRKINSPFAHDMLVEFLRKDVEKHGGSASEVIDMWGQLWIFTVCAVPGGTLLFKREVDRLEAIAFLFGPTD